jgi:hypothetical protein
MRLLLTLGALEKPRGVGTEFVNHLAASPAGRAGNSMIVDDRDRAYFELWAELGNRREDGGALRAVRHPVGSVLHVTTGKHLAGGGQQRSAHPELGVGRVGPLHGRAGSSQQPFTLSISNFAFSHRVERSEVPARVKIVRLIVNLEARLEHCFLGLDFQM